MPRKKNVPLVAPLLPEPEIRNEPWEEMPLYKKLFKDEKPDPYLSTKTGLLFQGDSIPWLRAISDKSVDLIFADPPFDSGRAKTSGYRAQEIYINWSMEWISESARILKPRGTLVICGFTEILADLKHPASKFFRGGCKWLIWYYKNKANMGTDWGRSHESLLILRKSKNFTMNLDPVRIPYREHTLKYPYRTTADGSPRERKFSDDWTPNPLGAKPKDVLEIPTAGSGAEEKTAHPAQKPEELLRKIIASASREGEIVLDPFAGSGTALVAADQLRRRWVGCEINPEYNKFAKDRICFPLTHKTPEEWLEFDRDRDRQRAAKN